MNWKTKYTLTNILNMNDRKKVKKQDTDIPVKPRQDEELGGRTGKKERKVQEVFGSRRNNHTMTECVIILPFVCRDQNESRRRE